MKYRLAPRHPRCLAELGNAEVTFSWTRAGRPRNFGQVAANGAAVPKPEDSSLGERKLGERQTNFLKVRYERDDVPLVPPALAK